MCDARLMGRTKKYIQPIRGGHFQPVELTVDPEEKSREGLKGFPKSDEGYSKVLESCRTGQMSGIACLNSLANTTEVWIAI